MRRALLLLSLVATSALVPASASAGIVPSGAVQIPLSGGTGSGKITSVPAGVDCVFTKGDLSGICFYVFTSPSLEPVNVVLTYTPNPGSVLRVAGGSTQAGPASTTITIADLGKTYSPPLEWTFLITTARLTVSTSGSGTGRVGGPSVGIDCGSVCSTTVEYGTAVGLTASPAAGSAFKGWKGGVCAGEAPLCIVQMTAPTAVEAVFELVSANESPGVLVGDAVVDVDVLGWRWLPRADHQSKQPRVLVLQLTAREQLSASLALRRPPREKGRIIIRKSFRAIPPGPALLRFGVLASEPKGRTFLEGALSDGNRNRLFVRCVVMIPDGLNGRTFLRRCSVTNPILQRSPARPAEGGSGSAGPAADALLART